MHGKRGPEMGVALKGPVRPEIELMESESKIPGLWTLEKAMGFIFRWARKNSLWPLQFGTACCAIEMMATAAGRYDIARFGAEVFRPSPAKPTSSSPPGPSRRNGIRPQEALRTNAQAQLGHRHGKLHHRGRPLLLDSYTVVKGIDSFIPVDVYVPGCPPRPESLLHGLMAIQKKIEDEPDLPPPEERRVITRIASTGRGSWPL